MYELKIYRGFMFHVKKEYTKSEEELTCHFKTDMRNLTNFDLNTQKSKKNAL